MNSCTSIIVVSCNPGVVKCMRSVFNNKPRSVFLLFAVYILFLIRFSSILVEFGF